MEELLNNTTSLFALFAVLLFIISFVFISKAKITTRVLVHTAVLIAIALVLSFIKIYHLPQGGSVTLAAMLPLLLISMAYGPAIGILAGFAYGVIHFVLSPYILHPLQVLFDYPLPYMAMGIAGFFPTRKYVGVVSALLVRFAFHVISGVVFFASYAPENMNPLVYSMVYNGSYLAPDLVIILVAVAVLPIGKLVKMMKDDK